MPFKSAGLSWPARTSSMSELTFFFHRLFICVVMPAKETPVMLKMAAALDGLSMK